MESVSQARWSPVAGRYTLLYLSDKAQGWWNIHKAEILHSEVDQEEDLATSLAVTLSPVLLCEGKLCMVGSMYCNDAGCWRLAAGCWRSC